MAKKLAVFCDGTWNDLRMADRTNVSRLAKCVAPSSRTGSAQIVFYDEGVGVGANISKAGDELVKLWGGAFGRGLDRKVEAAYRFIVLNYEPDDDIYVFGFSRGAYTARSLCGLIRKCGILKRGCFDQVPQAMTIYRDNRHPRDPGVVDFRARFAHEMSAGEEDHLRLGIDEGEGRRFAESYEELIQYRPRRTYRMMYVGLWDTVGSLGVPDRFRLLQVFNRRYDFHDTSASSLMASVRHAVSIDEDRRVFSSTAVDNVDDLNRQWAAHTGWDVTTPTSARYVPYADRPYQQLWFPGDHGAVGGGNPEPGLSSTTLLWIAQGAERAGLAFDHRPGDEMDVARTLQNPCADWRVNKDGRRRLATDRDFLGRVGGFRPRKGPSKLDEVGCSTWMRWRLDDSYRPANLTVLKGRRRAPRALPTASGFPR